MKIQACIFFCIIKLENRGNQYKEPNAILRGNWNYERNGLLENVFNTKRNME